MKNTVFGIALCLGSFAFGAVSDVNLGINNESAPVHSIKPKKGKRKGSGKSTASTGARSARKKYESRTLGSRHPVKRRSSTKKGGQPTTTGTPVYRKVSPNSKKVQVHRMPSQIPGIQQRVNGLSFNTHTKNNTNHTFLRAALMGVGPKTLRQHIKTDIIKNSRRRQSSMRNRRSRYEVTIGKHRFTYSLYHHPTSGILSVGSVADASKGPSKRAQKGRRKKVKARFKVNAREVTGHSQNKKI